MTMKRLPHSLTLVLLFVGYADGAEQKPTLSPNQAKAAIEQEYNEFPFVVIPLGKVEISHAYESAFGLNHGLDVKRSRYSQQSLKDFEAWEAIGILELKTLKDLTGEDFTGWDDWRRLGEGVGSEIQISLTERGRLFNASEDPSVAAFLLGIWRVTKIVDIEELQKDFDRYSLVSGFSEVDWTPEYRQFIEYLFAHIGVEDVLPGRKEFFTAEKRKFRALFKFDRYADVWGILAIDDTGVNVEFISNDVEGALRSPEEWLSKKNELRHNAIRPAVVRKPAKRTIGKTSQAGDALASTQYQSSSQPEPQAPAGSWVASIEAWTNQMFDRLGIATESRQSPDEPILLSQFQAISQQGPKGYRDQRFPSLPDGDKTVGSLACLAAVYAMIERGREGGDEEAMIDEDKFYPDPRLAPGGKTRGANPYSYVPEGNVSVNTRTIAEALQDGRPTILYGKKDVPHYVLVIGMRPAPDGTQKFVALDPWPGEEIEIDMDRLEHPGPGPKMKGMKFTQMRNVTARAKGWEGGQGQVADQDPARRIIEEALAAHGGSAQLGQFTAFQQASMGTFQQGRGTSDFTAEMFYQYPDRLRQAGEQVDLNGRRAKVEIVVIGERVGVLVNGQATETSAAYQQRVKTAAQVTGLSLLMPFVHGTFNVEPVQAVQIDGRWADGVKPSGAHIPDARMYFDRQTRLLRKVSYETIDADERPVVRELVYSAHRDWNGLKYAGEIAVSENGTVVEKHRITQLQFFEQLDPSVFEIKESAQSRLGSAVGEVAVGALLRALKGKD